MSSASSPSMPSARRGPRALRRCAGGRPRRVRQPAGAPQGHGTLIRASVEVARHHPEVRVVIAGGGRDARRLRRLIHRTTAPVDLLGRVADDKLRRCTAVATYSPCCAGIAGRASNKKGLASCSSKPRPVGVAQLAGRSGGSHEAVDHGMTGLIVDDPQSVSAAAGALSWLLDDRRVREAMGQASRARVVAEFTYDTLAHQLQRAIEEAVRRQ